MASIIGRKVEIDLTIRKFENENMGTDPLSRSEGEVAKFRVSEENKYHSITVEKALELLFKLIRRL